MSTPLADWELELIAACGRLARLFPNASELIDEAFEDVEELRES